MNLRDAITSRHSVRKYLQMPIEAEKLSAIQVAIDQANFEGGLHIQTVINESIAFSSILAKYGKFQNVANYLVIAAPKGIAGDETAGYYGEKIVLTLQTLGLNSCWVGLTYKRLHKVYNLLEHEEVKCVIAFGYGATQGIWHPLKRTIADVSVNLTKDPLPDWFIRGIKAALLSPSAANQHKYRFILHANNVVEAKTLFSIYGYTHIDLGIAKCHFEIAAGSDSFRWLTK